MAKLKRITRQRIADEVFEAIRRAILDRDFAPGERLDVRSLAAEFDVSPMPVRQAINRLNAIGLVEIKPRSGTFVARIDGDELQETFDIRRALEVLAAESAVRYATEEDFRELDEILAEMESLTDRAAERHDKLNTLFHRRIIDIARNRTLLEIYEDLNAHIKIAGVHLRSADWAGRVERERREHRQIWKALRDRDAEALSKALSEHIERAKQALVKDLEESQAKGAAQELHGSR